MIDENTFKANSNPPSDTTSDAKDRALQMAEAADRPLVDLLPYQKNAIESNARFTWNCWSRQTGKSFTFSLRRILRGLARRRNQIILSAGERQSREVMAKVRMHLQALQICGESIGLDLFDGAAARSLEVKLPGNVRIIALPANPMTARGYTGDVFLDEFAMHRDDEAIWSALFPTLLRGDGELDIASTPRGKRNLFYRLRNHERFEARTLTQIRCILGISVLIELPRHTKFVEQSSDRPPLMAR